MLNEEFVVMQIKPCLNSHNEMNWAEFYDLFSGLTKQEQYEVIQIMIKHNIDIVEEKEEEVKSTKLKEIPDLHSFLNSLSAIKREETPNVKITQKENVKETDFLSKFE